MTVTNLAQADQQRHPAAIRDTSRAQHTVAASIALHLLPGIAMLAFVVLVGPLVQRWDFPLRFAGSLSIMVVLVPLELGVLCYLGWRRNGRLSLAGIVHYRTPMPLWQQIVLVPLLVIWFLGISSLWRSVVPTLDVALAWVPAWVIDPLPTEHPVPSSQAVRWITGLAGVLCSGIIAPIVEELYFRGYLLPRIERLGRWAILLNVVLFAFHHLWTPLINPGRVLAWLPIVYMVWRTRNIQLGMNVHLATNLIGVLIGILSGG